MREKAKETTALVANLITVGCALVIAFAAFKSLTTTDPPPPPPPPPDAVRPQPDWAAYANGGHRIGSTTAKVTLIEFADFQCPACGDLERSLRELRNRYRNDLAIIYRHLPLPGIHPAAYPAAIASECAARQGRFTEMHDLLYEMNSKIRSGPGRGAISPSRRA